MEQKISSLSNKEQKKIRPKIEDVIPEVLIGEMRETALEFAAYLRENKMAPGWSGVHNAWDAKCKGKTICKISLAHTGWYANNKCSWNIKLYCLHMSKYESSIISAGVQSIIWDGLFHCISCLGGKKPCIGGNDIMILGREYKGICGHSLCTMIYDPDETTLDGVKKLLELEKTARNENT